jgi:pimeloyl-ACP methyl ester carboxylesterase
MERRELLKLGAAAAALTGYAGAAKAQRAQSKAPAGKTLVAADGTRLFLRDWGEGRPVLFLAGWTLFSDFWGYQMLELEQRGFRTLAYDRRGHGRSADPGRGYDFDTLADDLASVIGSRKLDGVTIVAHSMASGEVARYFSRHGGRGVRKVVLVAPTTPFIMMTADNPLGIDRQVLVASRNRAAVDFPGLIDAQIGPFFTPQTSKGMVEWVKSMMLQTSLQGVIELAQALQETDLRDDVRQIGVPTLVVHGDKDVSAPLALTGMRTAQLISNAKLSVYEGAPHGLPITHIERLNAELIDFAGA